MLDRFERFITYALLALIGAVVEAVLAVALIALARKIIVVEPKDLSPGTLLAIAALVVALAVGQYLVQRARRGP